MRITRKFLRELPIGHKETYKDVEVKSFNNVGTACTEVSRIDRVKEFIIKRDFEKWELTIEVKPYGYRKRLQDASSNEQSSTGEGNRTGGIDQG